MHAFWQIFVSVTLCLGSSVSESKSCAKEFMQNSKFALVKHGKLENNYFIIKDSIHYEYSNSKLYGVSLIKWISCDEYRMIVKETYDKEPGLRAGDTLSMKIQSIKGDTLTCVATAFKLSVPMTFVKMH